MVAFKSEVDKATAASDGATLSALVEYLLDERIETVVSREVLTYAASQLLEQALAQIERVTEAGEPLNPFWRTAGEDALRKLQPRLASFQEPDTKVRRMLGEVLIVSEEYLEAARVLGRINVEGGAGEDFTPESKSELYVKIAELYLMEGETVDAEMFISRASNHIHHVADLLDHTKVKMRYETCYAQVQDSKREFLKAAIRYYNVSKIQDEDIDPDDITSMLEAAAKCIILEGAGSRGRQRLMGTIYRDTRSASLECFDVLEKMYTERLLTPDEVAKFRESLADHQKAKMASGLTYLDRAVIEHNMLAASRVYSNIGFEELGKLLGCDASTAEKMAARMIAEGRLTGSIDQVANIIEFDSSSGGEALASWDSRVKALCLTLNTVSEKVGKAYPTVVPA